MNKYNEDIEINNLVNILGDFVKVLASLSDEVEDGTALVPHINRLFKVIQYFDTFISAKKMAFTLREMENSNGLVKN